MDVIEDETKSEEWNLNTLDDGSLYGIKRENLITIILFSLVYIIIFDDLLPEVYNFQLQVDVYLTIPYDLLPNYHIYFHQQVLLLLIYHHIFREFV